MYIYKICVYSSFNIVCFEEFVIFKALFLKNQILIINR